MHWFDTGKSQLDVKLVLPWKEEVKLEYQLSSVNTRTISRFL